LDSLYLGRNLDYDAHRFSGYSPFYAKNFKSIIIGDSVTAIGGNAFYRCTIPSNFKLHDRIESIGASAFYESTGLNTITLPRSLKNIGNSAFYNSGLIRIDIEDIATLFNIDFNYDYYSSFIYTSIMYLNGEKLKNIVIPDGVTEIGYKTFKDCNSLESVTIPSSMTNIETDAFSGCKNLKMVINYSNSFSVTKGDGWENGSVGKYAETVINAPNGGIVGDFVFSTVDNKHFLINY
jgi:hypothetical protein